MRKSQESQQILNRIEEASDFFVGSNFSLDHYKAAVAGIIRLDEAYHLEDVLVKLDKLKLILLKTALELSLPDEAKQEYMDQWFFLTDLYEEFSWHARHGIRLYQPM